jgi:hypothetical protein
MGLALSWLYIKSQSKVCIRLKLQTYIAKYLATETATQKRGITENGNVKENMRSTQDSDAFALQTKPLIFNGVTCVATQQSSMADNYNCMHAD